MVQNAKSSASQHHNANPQGGNKAMFVLERVGTNIDARATLDARRRDKDETESQRY